MSINAYDYPSMISRILGVDAMRLLLLPVIISALALGACARSPQQHGPFTLGASDGNHVGCCRVGDIRSETAWRGEFVDDCDPDQGYCPPGAIGADGWVPTTGPVIVESPVVTTDLPPTTPSRSAWE